MKKLVFLLVLVVAGFATANAQVNPHAIGVRFGGGTYYGAEVSYQHGLGESHRMELDLGWNGGLYHTRVFFSGIYHWHWNIVEGLNWYIGPGAFVGMYLDEVKLGVGVGGQVGIEYDFNTLDVPILVSLDSRPMFHFLPWYDRDDIHYMSPFDPSVALSVRYTF
ncbi:MAG: hypothetical protein KBB11_08655 [Bacteroidales bacterium]|nr:hypothetical protein [Bacteroidales bacterium]HOY38438.1 hypothetical protein [Bacteroidales bacterium]HQP03129.1 hypothetical protein [Bacteroidales bacterium]